MSKVIITGGSGFIGKNLISALSVLDAEIFILTRNPGIVSLHNNIRYVVCDLHNHSDVKNIINSIQASHLLHLAWSLSPSNYDLPENFDWLKTSINLLEEFQKNNGQRVIMIGSGFEYDWNYGYCSEDITPTSNNNLYSASKNILREFAFTYCKFHGLEIVWPRLFFLYGPHEHPKKLVAEIITSLLRGVSVTVNNGEIYRDYMYVKDTVNILSKLLFDNYNGVINISTGIPTKLGDIAKLAADIIGRPELLKIGRPEKVKNQVVYANVDKLNYQLSLYPKYDLKTGLQETVDWWKDFDKKKQAFL